MKTHSTAIVGCGYVGSRVAKLWRRRGWRVAVVSRSEDPGPGVRELADEVIAMHWCDAAADYRFDRPLDTLLLSVSHRKDPAPAAGEVGPPNDHAAGLENLLGRMPAPPRRLIYLSTTGVYAPADDGRVVDEGSPCEPQRGGSANAYAAELWLRRFADATPGCEVAILRPSGIYGPGRVPNLQAIRGGEAIAAAGEAYLNLIHVDDLAAAVDAIAAGPAPPRHRVYNVSDNSPVTRGDYYAYIAEIIAAPPPHLEPAAAAASVRPRGGGSKRVDAGRFLAEYGLALRYPDYRAGLSGLLNEERG